MKKIIALALALILVLGLFAGCGAKEAEVYEFTLSMHDPKTTPNAIYMQSWIDKVYEVTDGKVSCDAPRLALIITNVFNLQTNLFQNFTFDCFLCGFTDFNKSTTTFDNHIKTKSTDG